MDKKFIKECVKGNLKAQQKLYDLYSAKLYTVCFRYAVDDYMAQEMMQEGFIKIYKNLSKFKWNGSFEGWMHRIMINASLEYLRKNKRNHQQFSLEKTAFSHSHHSGIIDALSTKEIMQAIRELPDGYREVVNLYIIDGYSHKEVAKLLNISEDNSKQRLKRGRESLQKKLNSLHYIPDETF